MSQIYFDYPLNYSTAQTGDELLVSNNDLDSGLVLSASGTQTINFTGTSNITEIYIISNNITQISYSSEIIKKIRTDSDRQPRSDFGEIFFDRITSKDYTLIHLGHIPATTTFTFTNAANATIYEIYILNRIGTWQKIGRDYSFNENNRNEAVIEDFYGNLSKQRASDIRDKKDISFVGLGTRSQLRTLRGYAARDNLTFAQNTQLYPDRLFPAIVEITGTEEHSAQWQSDNYSLPYRVREI